MFTISYVFNEYGSELIYFSLVFRRPLTLFYFARDPLFNGFYGQPRNHFVLVNWIGGEGYIFFFFLLYEEKLNRDLFLKPNGCEQPCQKRSSNPA